MRVHRLQLLRAAATATAAADATAVAHRGCVLFCMSVCCVVGLILLLLLLEVQLQQYVVCAELLSVTFASFLLPSEALLTTQATRKAATAPARAAAASAAAAVTYPTVHHYSASLVPFVCV
jgi:hypothetical protein